MLRNYLRVAIRNLLKNRTYSLVNIIGLTIGLTGCLVLSNVVINELSYDTSWKNKKNIYRVISKSNGTQQQYPIAPSGLGLSLQKNFPEVINTCRILLQQKKIYLNNSRNEVQFQSIVTEPSIWSVFDFIVLSGSPQIFKPGYKNLVISKELKDKYFPEIDPVGTIIQGKTSTKNSENYLITGVIAGIPYNSHLRSEAIIVAEFPSDQNELPTLESGYVYPLYVLLKRDANVQQLNGKLNSWYKAYTGGGGINTYDLQPVTSVYLHSEFAKGYQKVIGNLTGIYIFASVAIILLLIACFNFVNLSTARNIKRIPEMGIRKVVGAAKSQLVQQFLLETLIFFIISFILALILYLLCISRVEFFIGHSLTIGILNNLKLFISVFSFVGLVSIITGLHPAITLSKVRAILVLKGNFHKNFSNQLLKKCLIIGQFTLSISIIIAALTVYEQLCFLNSKDLGYDHNNLLAISFSNLETTGKSFKEELKKFPGVQDVSITKWVPTFGGGNETVEVSVSNEKSNKVFWYIEGDIDLARTLKLHLLQGRFLDPRIPSDMLSPDLYDLTQNDELTKAAAHQSILLTRYAAQLLGITNLDSTLHKTIHGTPVGILENFNNESLSVVMKPCIIKANEHISFGSILVRIHPGTQKQVLGTIEHLWRKFYLGQELNFHWVDDLLEKQYTGENNLVKLFSFFSCIAVFLACIGLLGLITFSVELRMKEIGIRKALGSSKGLIFILISKDFLKLVIAALLIASPIAWWTMNKWLEQYAYRISISWLSFFGTGIIVLSLALISISFQALKAARINPANSLKNN